MNVDKLLASIDDERHEDIINLNHSRIAKEKNDILQTMQFKGAELKIYHKKLKLYRYVDEINQIKHGNYIRWFNIKEPENIKLATGAFFMEFKIMDKGCHLLCKTMFNKIIQIKLDECIIFQKLSVQEQVILSAVKYLNKQEVVLFNN